MSQATYTVSNPADYSCLNNKCHGDLITCINTIHDTRLRNWCSCISLFACKPVLSCWCFRVSIQFCRILTLEFGAFHCLGFVHVLRIEFRTWCFWVRMSLHPQTKQDRKDLTGCAQSYPNSNLKQEIMEEVQIMNNSTKTSI
jgi:hypothetical protein